MAKIRPKKMPPEVRSCLWSYDTNKIDLEKYKEMIIAQVLNYGDMKAVRWLFKTYDKEEIKRVVENPQRGLWFEKTLDYWLDYFDIKIPEIKRARALFILDPQKRKEYFKSRNLNPYEL